MKIYDAVVGCLMGICVSLLLFGCVPNWSPEGYQDVRWGMGHSQVENLVEGTLFRTSPDSIVMRTKIDNHDAEVHYIFVEGDKLAKVWVCFKIDSGSLEDNDIEYLHLHLKFNTLYGPPSMDNPKATFSLWNTKESQILLVLMGNIMEMQLSVHYESKRYQDQLNLEMQK